MTSIPSDSLPVSQDLVDTVIDTLEPELSLAVLDGSAEDVADVVRNIARPLLVAELRRLAKAADHFGEGHPWRDGALHMAAGMNTRADQLDHPKVGDIR